MEIIFWGSLAGMVLIILMKIPALSLLPSKVIQKRQAISRKEKFLALISPLQKLAKKIPDSKFLKNEAKKKSNFSGGYWEKLKKR